MNTINFTGTIIGGPNDGAEVTFRGTSEQSEDEVLRKMDKMEMDDHIYKIIELDKEKRCAVLQW